MTDSQTRKEFGKYSRSDLANLRDALGLIRGLRHKLDEAIESNPQSLAKLFNPPVTWVNVYECSFIDQVALFNASFGLSDTIHEIAQSSDPQAAALSLITDHPAHEDPPDGTEPAFLIGFLHSLIKTMECLMVYDWFLNELVKKVKSGCDKSLFQAISIDRTCVACPTIAQRFALAELKGEKKFFLEVAKSISKGPSEKNTQYVDLRYLLPALEDEGVLENLTQKQEYDLFVKELHVYPDGDDAERSLHQFIYRWRKKRSST
jgi:hypothetical protein